MECTDGSSGDEQLIKTQRLRNSLFLDLSVSEHMENLLHNQRAASNFFL